MASAPPVSTSFSLARRWSAGLTVLVGIVSAAALVVMLNYLGARYYARLDWSSHRQVALSPRTLGVLESLTNQVLVTVYFDAEKPLFGLVTALLDEYHYRCPRLQVEVVDYIRNTSAAKLAQARYQLTQVTDKDLVIFDCGGRVRKVPAPDLADVDIEVEPGGGREYRRRLLNFKGEMQFTAAILSVASATRPKAYFLQGHGEGDPENDDARQGYSEFAGVLRGNNVELALLTNLVAVTEVPVDCRLLIVAGPTTRLLPEELAKLEQYLAQGGRVLALLNYFGLNRNPELSSLLAQWGVEVGNNRVVDRANTVNGEDLLSTRLSGGHEILRPLTGTQLHLSLPRSISRRKAAGGRADAAKVEELVMTGPEAAVWTTIRDGQVYPNPAQDFRGAVPLVVAVERGGIKGISTERGTTRLVVAGDSFFLSNLLIDSAGNRDFAHQTVNWLLDRTQLVPGLGPKPVREFRLAVTASQLRSLRWLLLGLLPGSVLFVGGLVWLRRRR